MADGFFCGRRCKAELRNGYCYHTPVLSFERISSAICFIFPNWQASWRFLYRKYQILLSTIGCIHKIRQLCFLKSLGCFRYLIAKFFCGFNKSIYVSASPFCSDVHFSIGKLEFFFKETKFRFVFLFSILLPLR